MEQQQNTILNWQQLDQLLLWNEEEKKIREKGEEIFLKEATVNSILYGGYAGNLSV